jgi:hypothetical protein
MEQPLIQQLIALVTTSAPELWRLAKLQVLAINIQDGIIAVILFGFIVVTLNCMGRLRERRRERWDNTLNRFVNDKEEKGCHYTDEIMTWRILGWCIVFFSLIIVVCNIFSIIMRLVNPDYYAISVLIDLVRP